MKTEMAIGILLLSSFVSSVAATEDENSTQAVFNPPKPGTTIKWLGTKNGETLKEEHVVGKSSGLLARWSSGGKEYERYGLISWGSPDTFDTSSIDPLWPLKVGNSISYSRTKGNRSWNDSMTVTGVESVITKAGKFDTYIIAFKTAAQNNKWSGEFTAWFAPKLGWAVKREYSDSKGNTQKSEVVEIQYP